MPWRITGCAISALLCLASPAAAARGAVRYAVRMPRPAAHVLEVELRVRARLPLRVGMPAWVPGYYRAVDWIRNVRIRSARAGKHALRWRRRGRAEWIFAGGPTGKPRELRIRYQVLAREPRVYASHLDRRHAHLVGTSVFLLVPAARSRPHRVRFHPPTGWRAASELRAVAGAPWTFAASGYDELVDSPVELGTFRRACAAVGKARVCLVLDDPRARSVPRRWLRNLAAIARVHGRWFGGLPYRGYTVIVHTARDPGRLGPAGLEHSRGCSLIMPREVLGARGQARRGWAYRFMLATIAHEHFHVWNGKRLRPAPHGAYDYLAIEPTRMLWLAEGFTEYFTFRTLLAAGLLSRRRYLAELATAPLTLTRSLGDISHDAFWEPRYPGARSGLYYQAGARVALLLDLELRARTRGKVTLLAVLRALQRRARRGRGVTSAALLRAIRALSGPDLRRQLARWVDRPTTLTCGPALRRLGLRVARKARAGGRPAAVKRARRLLARLARIPPARLSAAQRQQLARARRVLLAHHRGRAGRGARQPPAAPRGAALLPGAGRAAAALRARWLRP